MSIRTKKYIYSMIYRERVQNNNWVKMCLNAMKIMLQNLMVLKKSGDFL